ncbi:hypothetical protein CFP56_033231, partial [Quercus suber]
SNFEETESRFKLYIKVQNIPPSQSQLQLDILLGSSLAFAQILFIGIFVFLFCKEECSEDMQLHGAEVVNMMRVAAWCLQNDFTKRPSMSMVVKVLEGAMNIEFDLDCFILNLPLPNMRAGVDDQEVHVVVATPLLPSVLSGPR